MFTCGIAFLARLCLVRETVLHYPFSSSCPSHVLFLFLSHSHDSDFLCTVCVPRSAAILVIRRECIRSPALPGYLTTRLRYSTSWVICIYRSFRCPNSFASRSSVSSCPVEHDRTQNTSDFWATARITGYMVASWLTIWPLYVSVCFCMFCCFALNVIQDLFESLLPIQSDEFQKNFHEFSSHIRGV